MNTVAAPNRLLARSGFTLIELLVAIAIIAILAAILFPVFQKVRENARRTACLSNEKQIGIAVVQYSQDYDEYLINGTNGYGGGTGWAGQVYSYIKSKDVFKCPDDSTQSTRSSEHASSYALNNNFAFGTTYSGCIGPHGAHTLAQLNAPTKTVMVFEVYQSGGYDVSTENLPVAQGGTLEDCGGSPAGNGVGSQYSSPVQGYDLDPTVTPPKKVSMATGFMPGTNAAVTAYLPGEIARLGINPGRHNGANYMFADGHAKFLRPEQVSAGASADTETSQQDFTKSYGPTAAGTNGTFDGTTQPAATFSLE